MLVYMWPTWAYFVIDYLLFNLKDNHDRSINYLLFNLKDNYDEFINYMLFNLKDNYG